MAHGASFSSVRRLQWLAIGLAALMSLVSSQSAASETSTCCDGSVVACPAGYVASKQLDLITGRAVSGLVSVSRLGADITLSLNTTGCFVAESVNVWLSYEPLPLNGKGAVAVSKFPYKFPLASGQQTTFSASFSAASLVPAATVCADSVTFALSAQTKCVCSNDIDCGGVSGTQSAWMYGARELAGTPWEPLSYCCGQDESEIAHDLKARDPDDGTTGEPLVTTGEEGTTGERLTTGDVDDGTTGETLPVVTTGRRIVLPGGTAGVPSVVPTTGQAVVAPVSTTGVFVEPEVVSTGELQFEMTTGVGNSSGSSPAVTDLSNTQDVGPANPMSAGVIAGMVVATAAVAAAVAAVLAKTAFSTTAVSQPHWMDTAVANPLYQAGEQMFENPLYDPPVENV